MDGTELIEALQNHKSFYGLLSRLFFSPLNQEEVDRLKATFYPASFGYVEGQLGLDESEELLRDGLVMMRSVLDSGDDNLRQTLNVDYTGSFYGVKQYEEKVATPYESVFRGESGLLFGEQHHEVYLAMKKDRLAVKEGIDLPDDHLSFELQYLAALCDYTCEDLREGKLGNALFEIRKQSTFIDEHILSWIDMLAENVVKLVYTDFYPGLMKACKGFVLLAKEELLAMDEDLVAEGAVCPEQID